METTQKAWRILQIITFYRVVLATLFALLTMNSYLPDPLASSHPQLFNVAVMIFFVASLFSIYPMLLRTPVLIWQVYANTTVDIIIFILLMHASGGVSSGLGMLLIVSIANASMLLSGRMSVFFASMASIAVLLDQIYTQFYVQNGHNNYSVAGLLGLALMVTSVLATVLARQARENADLAHERGLDLENMSELTEQVISQMDTGVLVVDQQQHVRLINVSARRLLDAPSQSLGAPLQLFSAELSQQMRLWLSENNASNVRRKIDTLPASAWVQIVNIRSGGYDRKAGVLIFLEDAALVDEQSQQLRLAGLGRLTAGIAHEIRNPLSSIRHASALLAESSNLPPEDVRLTDIICENTSRVNRIIEDVLQLGNRDRVNKEVIDLTQWLQGYLEEVEYSIPGIQAFLKVENRSIGKPKVVFDAGHLRQILGNLLQNASHFAQRASDRPPNVKVRVSGGKSVPVFVEVINNGPPVEEQYRERLFEPFFTTTAKGTGLGLYLSRELAQANQSHLAHQLQDNLTCFRLTFSSQAIVKED